MRIEHIAMHVKVVCEVIVHYIFKYQKLALSI